MPSSADYPFVRAWGRLMGSYDYYIRDKVQLAREDHAPANAVYRREDGTWTTTDDITLATTRIQLGLDPLPPAEPNEEGVLAGLAQAILTASQLQESFGLLTVELIDGHTLVARFSTGWSLRLTAELLPPDPSV
ncbi:hypothetical protein ACQPW3_34690 [Actinosynnema sp. CA-248983]